MVTTNQLIDRLFDEATPPMQRPNLIREFARQLHWTPSFEDHLEVGVPGIGDHLFVEHGVESAAVLSFLRRPYKYSDISDSGLVQILGVSYNHLVDWHVIVSSEGPYYLNNRTKPFLFLPPAEGIKTREALSSEYFDQVTSRRVSRHYLSCEDALVGTISRWKRILHGELGKKVTNRHISTLFNAIILIRCCEDFQNIGTSEYFSRLREVFFGIQPPTKTVDIPNLLQKQMNRIGLIGKSVAGINWELLGVFEKVDFRLTENLISDFYKSDASPFEYNFALMSKHALSRIYEKYVSIMEYEEDIHRQATFFAPLPDEKIDRKSGVVFTPQFVASFFAKYIYDNTAPKVLRDLKVIDPACGSGIFLRTFLELRSHPLDPITSVKSVKKAFSDTLAIDKDANACDATKLSLSLLHLVTTGFFPTKLNVRNDDAVSLALRGELRTKSFDLVMANPPYIPSGRLTKREYKIYKEYLGGDVVGRLDSYLAFIKLCLEIVKKDGFVCLVLPHAFLMADNAKKLRQRIAAEFNVRVLVDLSRIPVFGKLGVYSILLILQKKSVDAKIWPPAQIVQCKGLVGRALEACLEGRTVTTSQYSVFGLDQEEFQFSEWYILPPAETRIRQKIRRFKPLTEYLTVRQGPVTGSDKIFVRPSEFVKQKERDLYLNFLPDKDIGSYRIPRRFKNLMLYPYVNHTLIDEETLSGEFPETWKYLKSHRRKLEDRYAVNEGRIPWWRPETPRVPKNLLRPKIVCPHLMLTPRFAIDTKGDVAVSRSPFLVCNEQAEELTLLKFYCAVLNSTPAFWYLSRHAFKYGQGYNRLEVDVLRSIPVPDPTDLPPLIFRRIVDLVDKCLKRGPDPETEGELNKIICGIYGVLEDEIISI